MFTLAIHMHKVLCVHKAGSKSLVLVYRCGWTKEGLFRQAKRKCAAQDGGRKGEINT